MELANHLSFWDYWMEIHKMCPFKFGAGNRLQNYAKAEYVGENVDTDLLAIWEGRIFYSVSIYVIR